MGTTKKIYMRKDPLFGNNFAPVGSLSLLQIIWCGYPRVGRELREPLQDGHQPGAQHHLQHGNRRPNRLRVNIFNIFLQRG